MGISRGGDYRESSPTSIGEPDKVTAWPFKEPGKTTAWKEEELARQGSMAIPKDAPVELRDSELEAAVRRTEEIKKLMSPRGALGLPPLLDEARLEWGIPDEAFAARAVFDRIHIFPISTAPKGKTTTAGGIHLTQASQDRDLQSGHRGILISMGLTAADHCVSHGIELGHIVRTIRNAPHVQECARILGKPMHILVMRDGDLTGDETLEADLRAGRSRIIDEGGTHSYCHQLDGRKKQSALIQDQW